MIEALRLMSGGFLRPFGCGWFIREFLLGHGPEGSSSIDPNRGAYQADIFYHYKLALHKGYAEDAVAYENEVRIGEGKQIYTEEEYSKRVQYFLSRMPYNPNYPMPSAHPALLRQAAELSFESGGCVKFDLKAWSEELHIALCGVSNKRTLENFRLLAEYAKKRPVPPFLVASTLPTPGYVDKEEICGIAAFTHHAGQFPEPVSH